MLRPGPHADPAPEAGAHGTEKLLCRGRRRQTAPGLPSIRNMFFLYASTPGWSKGLTRDM